jgi:hypothetical protein
MRPPIKTKSPAEDGWYTAAYLTIDGKPHPSHDEYNFIPIRYLKPDHALEDMQTCMRNKTIHRGADLLVLWPGKISSSEALNGPTKPAFIVARSAKQ